MASVALALGLVSGCASSGRELPAPKGAAARLPTGSALAGATAAQSGGIAVSSPVVAPGGLLPASFLLPGVTMGPPLRWSGVPASTAEQAISAEVDATGQVLWLVTGLGPGERELDGPTVAAGTVRANSIGARAWSPPTTADGPVTVRVTVWALSAPLDVRPDATADQVLGAIVGQTAAKGVLKFVASPAANTGSAFSTR